MSASTVNLSAIIPSQEALDAMGRRRYQHPRVQQTRTKDKSARRWYFRARVDVIAQNGPDRFEERRYLGSVSEMNKNEAEKKRDAILSEGINKPEVFLTSQIKFGAVLDRWLQTASVRDSTHTNYTSVVNAHLRPQWGNVRMCDITPVAVEDWLIAKSKTHGETMVSTIRSRFTEVWKRALFWRFTRESCPALGMQKITRFAKPKRAKTLPTLEQYHRFIYLLDEPFRSIVVACTFTGLRISEAMALTVAQINSETAHITESVDQRTGKVGPVKTKNSVRIVPMQHMRGDISIPADAKPEDRPFNAGYYAVWLAVKEAAKLTEIDYPGFGCHTFRRMHNTMFRRQAGADPAALAMARQSMGHADQKTNDLYYVPDEHDVKQRAEVAEGIFKKVMETVN